ncbi:hypothetical protein, partial [Deinococcus planocerae]|uniref:hypothetical protein n=1 Tax=Deinococcus planocerae TaxID=1737569 RepID=UPI001CA4EB97
PLVFFDMTVHLETGQAHQTARQLSETFKEALHAGQPQPSPEHPRPYVMMVALIPLGEGP